MTNKPPRMANSTTVLALSTGEYPQRRRSSDRIRSSARVRFSVPAM
jgi:hypothetical protein